MVQEAPAATLAGQVLVWVKSEASVPAKEIVPIVQAVVPVFFTVTFLGALLNPEVWVPKLSRPGETVIGLSVKMETVFEADAATAMSSLPLLLKSPIARPAGPPLTGKTACDLKVPSPFPPSTETELSLKLAETKDNFPLALKSAAATTTAFAPIVYSLWFWNVPFATPSSTETDLFDVPTPRSRMPSPLKSPTTTLLGAMEVG